MLGAGSKYRGLRVLDVGWGSGVWGIAIAEADSDARITVQDLPKVLEQAQKYLDWHGMLTATIFCLGTCTKWKFPAGKYDLAYAGARRAWRQARWPRGQLFKRLQPSLKPGGRLAIIDMIPNDERSGPPFPLIFALHMLVHTEGGNTYTVSEYTSWLSEAGFSNVEIGDFGDQSGVAAIIAQK